MIIIEEKILYLYNEYKSEILDETNGKTAR
ncbi:hypothetical protein ES702_06900 [subsurface metagenome]